MTFKDGIIKSASERLATISEERIALARKIEDIDLEAAEIRDMLKVLGVKNPGGVKALATKNAITQGLPGKTNSRVFEYKSRKYTIKKNVAEEIIRYMTAQGKNPTFSGEIARIILAADPDIDSKFTAENMVCAYAEALIGAKVIRRVLRGQYALIEHKEKSPDADTGERLYCKEGVISCEPPEERGYGRM